MKYWYDTEFYEDGREIHLISIGIVAEDGRELYLENRNFDWGIVPVNHWLWTNVYPHLQNGRTLATKETIKGLVHGFITNGQKDFSNELWGYYSAYDHVVLAQLSGRMVDMPKGIPWFTRDVKQELERQRQLWHADITLPVQDSTKHHALNDARWVRDAQTYLEEREVND
jgi:hypothetical protein